jgi:hypothetical protein
MNKYRAYLVGEGGHFAGSRSFVCGTDAEATIWARQLVDGNDVELWSRDRFVIRLYANGAQGAASHEMTDGRQAAENKAPPGEPERKR